MAHYGMEVLRPGIEPITADIVFVHGLGGHRINTWKQDAVVWPRDLLGEKLPNVRVMTWGYDADAIHFLKQQGHQTILSHANDLLTDVNLERDTDEEKRRPVIFVGHSLGGLVIKQALCKASELTGQQQRRFARQAAIWTYCSGIMFMGTPHRGADIASWPITATKFAKLLGKAGNDDVLAALKSGSPTLESLQSSFAGLQGRFNLHTVLETQGIKSIGKIVEDHHATLGSENETTFAIQADHQDMCKFSNNRDAGYRRVAGALKEQVEDAQVPAYPPQHMPFHVPLSRETTGSSSPPLDTGLRQMPSLSPPEPATHFLPRYSPRTLQPQRSRGFSEAPLADMSELATVLDDVRKPPVLPPRRLLQETAYEKLLAQVLIVEGPDPPERFVWAINMHKALDKWMDAAPSIQSSFSQKPHDPASAKFKGDYLYLAAYLGDAENVQKALNAGADVEHTVLLGDCALNAALTFDHIEVIRILLHAGASLAQPATRSQVNEQNFLADKLAVMSGDTVRLLVEFCGKDAFPSAAVSYAVILSRCEVLQAFHEHGYDMLVRFEGATALHLAAKMGSMEHLRYLLDVGFPVDALDADGRTALFSAILALKVDAVQLLLESSARVDAVDKDGNTILHALILDSVQASEKVMEEKRSFIYGLSAARAPLDMANLAGDAPLHVAIANGLGDMAADLIECGADCDARDGGGWTPLHLCADGLGQKPQIAALLIAHGASLKTKLPGAQPYTPLEVARALNNTTMRDLYRGAAVERGVGKWLTRRTAS